MSLAGTIRRLAALAGVGLAAIVGTYIYMRSSQFPAMPPLLRNLPGNSLDPHSQEMFSQKVRDRFPVGSFEADLIRELWLEGFLPQTDLRAPKRIARFDSLETSSMTAVAEMELYIGPQMTLGI